MSSAPASRAFEVRHVQLARAAFAALAAVMITFSPDHSAEVGLAVFSGFAIATGIVHAAAVWLVYPAGARWPSGLLGILTLAAGMAGGIASFRTTTVFFVVVIAWAALTGLIETVAGWRGRRRADAAADLGARDAVVVGIVTILLAVGLAFVPTQYALQYYIADAQQSFTLTGITIGVGIFGAYAAIVAVFLAIAGFSPRKPVPAPEDAGPASQDGSIA